MKESSSRIVTYEPNALVSEIESGYFPELIRLVSEGYGKVIRGEKTREKKTIQEFDYPGRAKIYLYKDGNTNDIIGYFTAIIWKNEDNDKRGGYLRSHFREHKVKVNDRNLAFDVGGIVIDPRFRGQGIGPSLIRYATDDINPVMVVGQTKNPAAIFARTKALSDKYILVWGGKVISEPNLDFSDQVAQFATESFYKARQIYYTKELTKDASELLQSRYGKAVHASPQELVPFDKVDLSTVPYSLQPAFSEINAVQDELNAKNIKMVAWSPLVAVRKDVAAKIQNTYR
ncbi:MAG: GNAT family N-acetyltransferase [Candidatus Woesebacteria bacterium]